MNPDSAKSDDDLFREKVRSEIMRNLEELEKTRAETTKIRGESRWYPFVVSTGLILVAIGLLKLIL